MERVENTRQEILNIITSRKLTHEQKLTNLAGQADSLLEVLDLPDGLEDLLEPVEGKQCICDLFEGHAPVRPRYIVPDYAKFMREGSKFLQLDPPKDIYEAINSLLIFYKNVPSVTNYPVYLGNIDEIIEKTEIIDGKQKYHIDTTLINKMILEDVGIDSSNIYDSGLCTVCKKDIFHSYRVDREESGRNSAIITLV